MRMLTSAAMSANTAASQARTQRRSSCCSSSRGWRIGLLLIVVFLVGCGARLRTERRSKHPGSTSSTCQITGNPRSRHVDT